MFFIESGQGETVLLQLEGKFWVLIDCYLPKGPVRDSFFEFVEHLKIQRLDLLCLTHPHEDHYHGMIEVINYFTTAGRTLGKFCDGGTTAKEILTFMKRRGRPKSAIREFEALDNRLTELIKAERVDYIRADENTGPIIASRDLRRLLLAPVGPPAARMKFSVREGALEGKAGDLNLVSLVLQLRISRGDREFDALFCGDNDGASVNRVLGRLEAAKAFDLVKVAHHGSHSSHEGSQIVGRGKRKLAIAVICSGMEFAVLPDREVMRDFLNGGWTVLLTCRRVSHSRRYAVQAVGRCVEDVSPRAQTIKVEWSPDNGVKWSPETARVTLDDLRHYQTASKS